MSCAPGNKNTISCYTITLLKAIARSYNKNKCKQNCIPIHGRTKKQLYSDIKNSIKECYGKDELCWIEQKYIFNGLNKQDKNNAIFYTFRPTPDKGNSKNKDWRLSTNDINNVLRQYQKVYPDFKSFGAVPSDFNTTNIINTITHNTTKQKFGIVINDDPSTLPGSHWVAVFIKKDNNKKNTTIEYYDSYGQKPITSISKFIHKLKKTLEHNNHNVTIKINKNKIQKSKNECGMFSINFIISRLRGNCFTCIKNTDQEVHQYRYTYFR